MKDMFLITADVAEGIDGNDRSSASVWDVVTWEQVAHWVGYCDPSQFAYVLRDMGVYYNWAMIAPETNFPGNATYAKLLELGYPKLWTGDDHAVPAGEPWKTTSKSRPLAITALREAMREGTIKINSAETLSELRTFVRRKNGKLEAEQGAHDDCVMEAAIAAYILKSTALSEVALSEIRRQPLREIFRRTSHNYSPGSKAGIV